METIKLELSSGPAHSWEVIGEFVPFHLWNQEHGYEEAAWQACPSSRRRAGGLSPLGQFCLMSRGKSTLPEPATKGPALQSFGLLSRVGPLFIPPLLVALLQSRNWKRMLRSCLKFALLWPSVIWIKQTLTSLALQSPFSRILSQAFKSTRARSSSWAQRMQRGPATRTVGQTPLPEMLLDAPSSLWMLFLESLLPPCTLSMWGSAGLSSHLLSPSLGRPSRRHCSPKCWQLLNLQSQVGSPSPTPGPQIVADFLQA